jgi:alpha-glucosidase
MVELPEGIKVVLTEADLENYPGMYIKKGDAANSLTSDFAPYPDSVIRGGYSKVEMIVKRRKNFIATTDGTRLFPWRVLAIADQDKKLLDNDLVFKLASKSRIADPSWIRPGKVAWDWWNDWNISHVDFRAGINTATYKYYIDFAAKNHIQYVLLDDGWSEKTDIMKVVPTVDLQELVYYGRQKNVGMMPINEKMDVAFDHYAAMGIKGFKIDFMDRDDQEMVKFNYKAATKAAQRKLMIDLHGAYKPTGLQRTYPNVVNVEGVYGMENLKVNTKSKNFPQYETIIPYVRMLAGPLDYTPGAMRNTTKTQFQSSYRACRQVRVRAVINWPCTWCTSRR